MELDARVVVGPFEPIHAPLRALQRLRDLGGVGHTQRCQCRVAKEDQLSPTSQQSRRLRYPFVGIAPDRSAVLRDREIEAVIAERHELSVRLDEQKTKTGLAIESLCAR